MIRGLFELINKESSRDQSTAGLQQKRNKKGEQRGENDTCLSVGLRLELLRHYVLIYRLIILFGVHDIDIFTEEKKLIKEKQEACDPK